MFLVQKEGEIEMLAGGQNKADCVAWFENTVEKIYIAFRILDVIVYFGHHILARRQQ